MIWTSVARNFAAKNFKNRQIRPHLSGKKEKFLHNFAKYLIFPQKMAKDCFKFCLSDNISPNLVTLQRSF